MVCMDCYGFVWIVMGLYEFVDFYMKFLLELGFEVLKSVSTYWEYRIHPWSMNSCL